MKILLILNGKANYIQSFPPFEKADLYTTSLETCDKYVINVTGLLHVFVTCDKHVTSQNAIVTCFCHRFLKFHMFVTGLSHVSELVVMLLFKSALQKE